MRFRRPKKLLTKKQKVFRAVLLAGAVLLCALIWLDSLVRPAVETYTAYQSRSVSTDIMNRAVVEVLEAEGISYDDLVTVHRGEDGRVLSVTANSAAASLVRTRLTQKVSDSLAALSYETIRVPLGTMLRLQLLTGRGPEISFHVRPASYVAGTLISEFTSAGINQTRHSISIRLSVEMAAVMPGYSTTVMVETDIALSETILLGEVPSTYLQF